MSQHQFCSGASCRDQLILAATNGGPNVRFVRFSQAIERALAGGFFLWLAKKSISICTAYTIWTGIGAAGTILVGVLFFGGLSSLMRYVGVLLNVAGVVTLKLASCGLKAAH